MSVVVGDRRVMPIVVKIMLIVGVYIPDRNYSQKNLTNWTDNLSGSLAPGRGMSPTPICVGCGSAVYIVQIILVQC